MIEVTKYIYFWLNYFDKDNHVERILVAADYIVYLFCIGSESPESDELNLVLISDGTWINDNEYLNTATELIISTE